jgi:hypothetical protein
MVHPNDTAGKVKYDSHSKKEKRRNVKHFGILDLNDIIQEDDINTEIEEIFYR